MTRAAKIARAESSSEPRRAIGPGRPKLPAEQRRTERVTILLTPSESRRLERAAGGPSRRSPFVLATVLAAIKKVKDLAV